MIPRHSNPLLLLTSSTIVSRAALNEFDGEREPVHDNSDHAQMVARLEKILKRSIEIEEVLQKDEKDSPMEQNHIRKKKRRKVDSETTKKAGEEAILFRLLSGTSQPKPISLAPKAGPKYTSHGPAAEDTREEAERRAARAREVAVDFTWVLKEASKPTVALLPITSRKLTHVAVDATSSKSPLLVVELRKSPSRSPHVLRSHPSLKAEPSPHHPKHKSSSSCCPVLQAQVLPSSTHHPEKQEQKRKRRRGKQRDKPAIQPMFWRPPLGIGGKSLGYAWGYAGSAPMQPGEAPRYARDTMRKALYA